MGLTQESSIEAILADGRTVALETFGCYFDWFGGTYHTQVVASDSAYPLLGTQLLASHRLVIDYSVEEVFCLSFRNVAGNPFEPVEFDPRWRTDTVMALARGIHAEAAFDRMPILADAMEEAGCHHPAILSHCRAKQNHVRGCWVISELFEDLWE